MISFAEALSGIERFTFIPMLTPNDGSCDGQQTAYPQGVGDATLYKFLRQCATQERRSIIHLRDFLIGQFRFEYCHYHDESYFRHAERGAYFQNVPNEYLQKAVTLVYPDNGLEVRSMRPRTGHKYIRYDEVNKIFLRMSRTSILVIFQYFPLVQRQPYLRRRFQELHSVIQCPFPMAISDNEVTLIILAKSNESRTRVLQLMNDYTSRNERLWVFDSFVDPLVSPI